MSLLLPVRSGATSKETDLAVFLLYGQSNMVGSGYTLTTPKLAADAAIVLTADRFSVTDAGGGNITVPSGPGLGFARALYAAGYGRIGLLGCALGGANLGMLERGTPLYREAVGTVHAAGYRLAGMLIQQGESDANAAGYAPPDGSTLAVDDWARRFAQLVADLRADLHQPDLPLVYGRLAHTASPDYGNWSRVQAQQDAARALIGGSALIDPEPVVLRDLMHWTDASYELVGQKMATAWLGMGHA